MRVILKPAGLILIVAAFALLTFVALGRNRAPGGDPAAPVAANSAPAPANSAAVRAAASAAGGAPAPAPAPAASRAPMPKGVLLMPDIAADDWKSLTTEGTARSSVKIVPATVPGHPHARRITIEAIGEDHWNIQIAHTLDAPFKKGQKIRLTYWARSKDSCPIAATVEQSAAPYTKIVYREVKLTPEWKQFSEEWEQQTDTPPGWAKVDFQVGYKVGEIEITGVIIRLVN